jgi:ABC-type spermidine/putrescine transport system permease subunit I
MPAGTSRSAVASWLLAAPAVMLLAVFFLIPLLLLLRVSVYQAGEEGRLYQAGTWSVTAYSELLGERFGRGVIGFTVVLGIGVAFLAVMIGYPLAFFIHTLPRNLKRLALGAVLLPKLANVYVVLYGVNLLLGHSGPVNHVLVGLGVVSEPLLLTHNLTGVLIAETYLILPYAVLVLVPVFDAIDPTLVAASRGLGADMWSSFRRVTLPLSLPGVVVAGQLCLIWALGAFVGPVLLGGPDQATLSVLVERESMTYNNWPRAAATAVLTLVTIGVCVAVYSWPARRAQRP